MKIMGQRVIVLAGVAMMAAMGVGGGVAQSGAGPLLLVANQGDHTLSLIDPVAGRQIAAVPVGGVTGHEVAVSADGTLAYVPIYGDSGVGRAGTDGSSMSVIDLKARKVVATVDFGHGVRPHMPLVEPVSGMLYVTTELDKAVTVIDPKTLKIVGQIPTGQEQSHMLVVTRDGKRGYTANVGPGTVSVLDMLGRKTIAVIPVSGTTQRISISRDQSMVCTADQTKPQMAVIDTATNKVKTWIPLPAVGYGSTPTLDGRWLLVQMGPAKQVAVIDLSTMKVARTIDVPAGSGEILMRPDGKVAYVSCPVDGKVAEIDLATWKVAKVIDAGHQGRWDGLGEVSLRAWAQGLGQFLLELTPHRDVVPAFGSRGVILRVGGLDLNQRLRVSIEAASRAGSRLGRRSRLHFVVDQMLGAVDILGRTQQQGDHFAAIVKLHAHTFTLKLPDLFERRGHDSP